MLRPQRVIHRGQDTAGRARRLRDRARRLSIALAVGIVGLGVPARAAAQVSGELLQKLQSKLNELHATHRAPGVTFAVVLRNGASASLAAGWADVERRIPMRPNDHMLSGSIGKTYVSALMLRLVQDGKANLDDKVQKYLGREPWYGRVPNAEQITIRMLLNHTSGVPNHVVDVDFTAALKSDPDRMRTHEEIVGFVLDKPPVGPAGTTYRYSDTNYFLVGMVIEKITGRSYYDELTRTLLEPLGLRNTFPSDRRVIPELVSAYTDANNPWGLPAKVSVDGRVALNPQIEWGGGGLVSTSLDLARWAHALYGGNVLAPAMRAEMVRLKAEGPDGGYGLGVYVRPTPFGVSYGHGGQFPGYRSAVAYYPRYGFAVAAQVNTDDSRAAGIGPRDFVNALVPIIVRDLEAK